MTQPPEGQPHGWVPVPTPAWPGAAQPDTGQHGQASYGQPAYGQAQYDHAQYEQVQYGQPGYGQGWQPAAGWGAPPPQRPGNRTTVWVLSVLGAVLALVLVAVVVVIALRDGDDDAGSGPASTASAAATDDLLDSLPADLLDCEAADTAGDGDIASATCGAGASTPGPDSADFYRYRDTSDLDAVFSADVTTSEDDGGLFPDGLTDFGADGDCGAGPGYGDWSAEDSGDAQGQIACGVTSDGHAVLVWTDEEFLTEGLLWSDGGSQDDVDALVAWWDENGWFEN